MEAGERLPDAPLKARTGELHEAFFRHREKLEKALEVFPVWDADSVLGCINNGEAFFFDFGESFLITQVIDYPLSKTLLIWIAGGQYRDVHPGIKVAENWGRYIGCDRIEMAGRRGWEKPYKDEGYDFAYIGMTKEL